MTVPGIHRVLAEIKARGWDQVQDTNHVVTMVDDIDLDPNTDDMESTYLIEDNAVIKILPDGLRGKTVWTRAD